MALRKFPTGRIRLRRPGRYAADRRLPPGLAPEKKTAASGFVLILPYLEMQSLFDQLECREWRTMESQCQRYRIGTAIQAKNKGIKEIIPTMVCPSDAVQANQLRLSPDRCRDRELCPFQWNEGPRVFSPAENRYDNNGLFVYVVESAERGKSVDGLSNTMMLGEVVLSDTWESSNTWSYTRAPADSLRTHASIRSTLGPAPATWKNNATARSAVSIRRVHVHIRRWARAVHRRRHRAFHLSRSVDHRPGRNQWWLIRSATDTALLFLLRFRDFEAFRCDSEGFRISIAAL